MPILHSLWMIDQKPKALPFSKLTDENELENMIVSEPSILSDEWMIIGRQVTTDIGGKLDLLAIAPDASLILIELKKNRTPRDVIAQALDYASWVENLDAEAINRIYENFKPHNNFSEDFENRFGYEIEEEAINNTHQIVIVASSLDNRTERIIGYLSERDIAINILYFQIFACQEHRLLSRAWLRNPSDVQMDAAISDKGDKEPWNGEFYASFGQDAEKRERKWEEARKYGFIAAGGGRWYSGTLDLLNPGDRIWVKIPDHGFVGVGRVKGKKIPLGNFFINEKPALNVLEGNYHRQYIDEPDKVDYFVPVEWLKTVSDTEGLKEVGLFGNQNTICKPKTPKWRRTIERLKIFFDIKDE